MTGFLARLAGIAGLILLVTACTGADSTFGLGKKKDQTEDQAAAAAQFPTLPGEAPAQLPQTPGQLPQAPGQEIAQVYFAPVVGASIDMVNALSQRLGVAAKAYGIRLVPAGTPGTTNELKGYFSAFSENGSTTVVHVWDVVSPSGQRVHRIQGQEVVPGAPPDPWAAVQPATMAAIADKVVAAYAAWLKSGA